MSLLIADILLMHSHDHGVLFVLILTVTRFAAEYPRIPKNIFLHLFYCTELSIN